MLIAILALLSLGLLAFWIQTLIPMRHIMKKNKIKWRALYKQYAYHFEDNPPHGMKAFLLAHLLLSTVPCLWVAYFSYDTDWSFLIFLFPIVWYYFWLRFFFWEKSDLHD